jgi:hypothetical protein
MSIYETLEHLGLVSSRTKKRVLLHPVLVEAALARLPHPLSHDEQKVVLRAISDPKKVNWPDWWKAS